MPRTTAAFITLLILVLAGCHGFFQKPVLQSITISPATGAVNATTQLVATGTYDDGSTGTINSGLTWSSGTTSVATIDPNSGLLTGSKLRDNDHHGYERGRRHHGYHYVDCHQRFPDVHHSFLPYDTACIDGQRYGKLHRDWQLFDANCYHHVLR